MGTYFFIAQNKANNHPTPVHPKTHEAIRIRIASVLDFLVWAARYAGASIIPPSTIVAAMYLIINTVSASICMITYFPYVALFPNSSSIRNNWLYFAIRSVRDIDPVLICPAFVATAKSAMVVSSVSPLR